MADSISISKALQQAVACLQDARVSEPRLTADVLLGHLLGRDRAFLYAHGEQVISQEQFEHYQNSIRQRCTGTPTQYITGVQEFYGLPFRVTPDVLIPRPETELLVEHTLALASPNDWILDIGTGSGAIAVVIKEKLPDATVFASDISRAALAVARENARNLGCALAFLQADLLAAFRRDAVDLVVCNPPYVSTLEVSSLQREVRDNEPHIALFGGEDGLEAYRCLSTTAHDVLRPGGWLLMEVGYNTSAAAKSLFAPALWEPPLIYRDLAGWERVMAVRKEAPAGDSSA